MENVYSDCHYGFPISWPCRKGAQNMGICGCFLYIPKATQKVMPGKGKLHAVSSLLLLSKLFILHHPHFPHPHR